MVVALFKAKDVMFDFSTEKILQKTDATVKIQFNCNLCFARRALNRFTKYWHDGGSFIREWREDTETATRYYLLKLASRLRRFLALLLHEIKRHCSDSDLFSSTLCSQSIVFLFQSWRYLFSSTFSNTTASVFEYRLGIITILLLISNIITILC